MGTSAIPASPTSYLSRRQFILPFASQYIVNDTAPFSYTTMAELALQMLHVIGRCKLHVMFVHMCEPGLKAEFQPVLKWSAAPNTVAANLIKTLACLGIL